MRELLGVCLSGSVRDESARLEMIPGKEALAAINNHLQDKYGVNLTPTAIVDAMKVEEVPDDLKKLVLDLSKFSKSKTPAS